MPPLGDAARGGSEPSKVSNSAPNVGHSSSQDDVSTVGPELANRDVNTTDNVWTRADTVRFVLLTIKIYCSGSPDEVQDFITGSAMFPDHSAESTVMDPISDSRMSRHSGNFTGELRTKGELALFILVTIKANLPHDPDFEARFEHRLHDTTPLSGQEDFDDLSDEEFAWYRKFLNFQLERSHKAEEKSYARLSRDPERNRISTMRNGGFTWIEVSSPESAPNYGAGMAVESPADDLCYDSTSGVIIRRMRTIWIANTPTGADPEAYVLFTVPSSGRDSLHADDRDKCIEVIHSSNARALNPKGVVVVEGANLLLPGSRHFMLAMPFRIKWNEPMAELKADQAEGVAQNSKGGSLDIAMRMSAVGIQELQKFRNGRSATLVRQEGRALRPRYDIDTSANDDYALATEQPDMSLQDVASTAHREDTVPGSRAERRRLQREKDAKSKKASVAARGNRG